VLEVNAAGQPVQGTSPILTQGQHALSGLCVDPASGAVFESEPGVAAGASTPGSRDEINLIVKGRDFGWPSQTAGSVAALATLPAGSNGQLPGASGCAVVDGVLYLASLDGTSLYGADITTSASSVKLDTFSPSLVGTYGRLITVVADPDGSLWLATANSGVTPAPKGASSTADERILHIQPAGGGASSVA
jgi:glucose/arabinose dehydrogenase